MPNYRVDFSELKQKLKIEDVAAWLNLEMKVSGNQLRGACPYCQTGGPRALAITPSKGSWYCFAGGKGGDVIGLTAHIHGTGQKEAAEELAGTFLNRNFQTERNSPKGNVPQHSPQPRQEPRSDVLEPLTYLEASHPAVEAVGLSAADAEALGIGYSPRGIMRGLVAVPVRLENGDLAGYIGLNEIAKLPPRWFLPERKVVPMKRGAA